MFYFVHSIDGHRLGPVDTATLRQWADHQVFGPESMIEDASTGVCFPASEIPHRSFAAVLMETPLRAAVSIHAEIGEQLHQTG